MHPYESHHIALLRRQAHQEHAAPRRAGRHVGSQLLRSAQRAVGHRLVEVGLRLVVAGGERRARA